MFRKILFLFLGFSSILYAGRKERSSKPDSSVEVFDFRPAIDDSLFFFGADLLIWITDENIHDYVSRTDTSPFVPNQTQVGLQGDLQEAKFDWRFGFRVNAAFDVEPEFWGAEAVYTYFDDKGSVRDTAPLLGTFFEGTVTPLDSASTFIDFREHLGDLYFFKRLHIANRILMRLLAGLTGGYLKQDWTLRYFGAGESTINRDWKFRGFGMMGGINLDWFFGAGLGIITNLNVRAIYGRYEAEGKQVVEFPTYSYIFEDFRLRDKRIITDLQMQVGAKWGTSFGYNGFELSALYEMNVWNQLNEVYKGQTVTNSSEARISWPFTGTLATHGFTGKVEVFF